MRVCTYPNGNTQTVPDGWTQCAYVPEWGGDGVLGPVGGGGSDNSTGYAPLVLGLVFVWLLWMQKK